MLLPVIVWSGGPLSCLSCFLDSCPIQSLKPQCSQYGKEEIMHSYLVGVFLVHSSDYALKYVVLESLHLHICA